MASRKRPVAKNFWRALHSVRTGIVLLMVLGLASAAGTFILQRPLTDSGQLARAYSPGTLRWLDRLGLTDVFHSWWFAALLGLLGLNIVLASLERFPVAWKYFRRPYDRPDPHFLAALPLQKEIPIRNQERGIEAAEGALRRQGLHPRRVAGQEGVSVFAERNRFARFAAYVVHASLLLVFGGAIADAIWGYRGYVALTQNQQADQIELRDGRAQKLPFTIRCDAAGRENYPDGSPRRWWSQVTVVDAGRELPGLIVEVNSPLVHRGIRFYQSGYGSTGELALVRLQARVKSDPHQAKEIDLRPGETLPLDAQNSVRLAAFFPDFVLRGREVETRSQELNNPAIQLVVGSKSSGEAKVWLFPRFPHFPHPDSSPYAFEVRDIQMGYFTGLQVSREPGQWAVWAGVILMGIGLAMAFYFAHVRFWAVPVGDSRGRWVLWVGASASKNREEFSGQFQRLVQEIESLLQGGHGVPAPAGPSPGMGTNRAASLLKTT